MEKNSRTQNAFRNTLYSFGGQIFTILLNFINRSVFISVLGIEYLGISGLFSNILSMLSLAELGIGTSIIYSLYKPLADKDVKLINGLMNFYSKAYKIIGFTVFCIGMIVLPFLNFFIKDRPDIPNLELIYVLFLLNSVVSYFFTYKRSILIADQKLYINSFNQNKFYLIQTIAQILFLLITHNYILYLIIQIICTLLSNITVSMKVNQIYPYLNSKVYRKT